MKNWTKKKVIVGGIAALAIFAGIGNMTGTEEEAPAAAAAAPEATETPAPTQDTQEAPQATTEAPEATTEAPEPLTNDELIGQALADSGVKGAAVDEDFENLVVTFPVQDNFSAHLIKVGAENDAKALMEALNNSEAEFTDLGIRGTFPLVDNYGNETDGQVLWAYFEQDSLNKINWDNLLILELSEIADAYAVHPDLRD